MSTSRYIIREFSLGYNDEVYYDAGYTIHEVYADRQKAETALKKLQLERVRSIPIAETSALFDGSEAFVQEVDKFIQDRTGVSILKGGDHVEYGTDLPNGMNDTDLLKLGEMIDTLGFEIIELADTHMLYVLWNPEEDEPFLTYDESGEFMIYARTEESLMSEIQDVVNAALDDEFSGEGTYEELSDNPGLLKSLVESSNLMQFNEEDPAIELLDELDVPTLQSLNGLLKKPVFKVREMSTQKIVELEQEMTEY